MNLQKIIDGEIENLRAQFRAELGQDLGVDVDWCDRLNAENLELKKKLEKAEDQIFLLTFRTEIVDLYYLSVSMDDML